MARNAYWCNALIGGATYALDALDGDDADGQGNPLAEGDVAIVITSTYTYFYWLDATSGAAESSPDTISPDTNAGTKRWILKETYDSLSVLKTLFDANTILAADSDNTPAALTVAEQTLVGRITSGNITDLTATQVRTLLNIEDGADVTDAANVNTAGAVMESDYDANTILAATADNTPVTLTVGEQTFVGRITSGNIAALTPTQGRTLLNVEDGADVTDATNVNSAGAVMESDYDANTVLAATSDNTPVTLTIGEQTLVGRITAGNIAALTPTQIRTLINVEDGADVTDATNVNTAGAVMEIDYDAHTILYAVSDNTPVALTVGASTIVGRKSTGNIVALTAAELRTILNIEDGADVTDTANVNTAGAIMESDYSNKGIILVGTGVGTWAALAVGSDSYVLTADSVEASGVKWASPGSPGAHDLAGASHNADTLADLNLKISDATLDNSGDPRDPNAHALGGAAHSADTLANLNSKVSDATLVDTGAIILKTFMAAKGDLISASADDTPVILTVGTNGYRLVADSGEASGLKWEAIPAASTTVSGEVELATVAETTTGTDATRAVTPDGLAGSVFGQKDVCIVPFESDTDVATGDGKVALTIPATLNGMNLVDVIASVHTQGITGTTDIQLRRRRAGADVDMLSTKVTIGAEYYASDEVINGTNDDVNTGDQIYVDVDAVHSGTAPKGLSVTMTFRLP